MKKNKTHTKTKTFTTQLAPAKSEQCGGYASGTICPHSLATRLFQDQIPGPWLLSYMLRRFGWPNTGSDSYKQTMTWCLTTPMSGLYLCVTPYLGQGGAQPFVYHPEERQTANLHFAVRFTHDIGRKLDRDPGRETFLKRRYAAVNRWWQTKGVQLYAWGVGTKTGDKDILAHAFCDSPKHPTTHVYGLWQRTVSMGTGTRDLPARLNMREWWLSQLIKDKHPEDHAKLPKMNQREQGRRTTRFQLQVGRALQAAMKDLLRPTRVRDIFFTPFGDIERAPQAIKHYHNQKYAPYFPGAGMGPEYYYLHATAKEKRGEE